MFSLIVYVHMSARSHSSMRTCVLFVYVDQLLVFVQWQCCRSVLSGRAPMRAGAILGSAVMLLLLFDAVLLRAL